MAIEARFKSHFFEGGNVATAIVIPVAVVCVLYFYGKIATAIKPYEISVADVYSYVFNLFAIEFGALLSLFGLFACRPTPFLERMKNTATFHAIVANTNITLLISTFAIAVTFMFGILKVHPDATLTVNSLLYVFWCVITVTTCSIYLRTVRLILSALA